MTLTAPEDTYMAGNRYYKDEGQYSHWDRQRPSWPDTQECGNRRPPGDQRNYDRHSRPPGDQRNYDGHSRPPGDQRNYDGHSRPPGDQRNYDGHSRPPGDQRNYDGHSRPPGDRRNYDRQSSEHFDIVHELDPSKTSPSFRLTFDFYTPRAHFIILGRDQGRDQGSQWKDITEINPQQQQHLMGFVLNAGNLLLGRDAEEATLSIHRGSWVTTKNRFHCHICTSTDLYLRVLQHLSTQAPMNHFWPSRTFVTRKWEASSDPEDYCRNVLDYPYSTHQVIELAAIIKLIIGESEAGAQAEHRLLGQSSHIRETQNSTEGDSKPTFLQNSTEGDNKPSSQHNSNEGDSKPSSSQQNSTEGDSKPTSQQNSTAGHNKPSAPQNLTAGHNKPSSFQQNSTEGDNKPSSSQQNSTEGFSKPTSRQATSSSAGSSSDDVREEGCPPKRRKRNRLTPGKSSDDVSEEGGCPPKRRKRTADSHQGSPQTADILGTTTYNSYQLAYHRSKRRIGLLGSWKRDPEGLLSLVTILDSLSRDLGAQSSTEGCHVCVDITGRGFAGFYDLRGSHQSVQGYLHVSGPLFYRHCPKPHFVNWLDSYSHTEDKVYT